ncbi:MAG TPA: hypothetical protein VF179_12675 [Thermoanaerobaculia bacterium]|nr:hypothetical protein [Thermoanaerobaculia bacterium]
MGPQAIFIAFRGRMLGRAIVHKRLFLRTLQLYLEPEPGVELGLEVWCEPDWQVVGRDGVIAGSGTIDFDTEAEDPDVLHRMVSRVTDVLKGCIVEDAAVDAQTFELEIQLSGGLAVRTFVSDPTEPDQWLIRDPSADIWLSGTPAGLQVETSAERDDRRG